MHQIVVEAEHIAKRLDVILGRHEAVGSRAEAQRMIRSGHVLLNQISAGIKPKTQLKAGDIIQFSPMPVPPTEIIPVKYELNIHYEDEWLLIVNKPQGMVVHPAPGHHQDTLVNYLLYYTQLSGHDPTRPGIVHRIDKDTSGLLVVAKKNDVHDHLAGQFADHSISRIYHAIVWGLPRETKGTIDKPLGRHPVDRKRWAVKDGGKRAVTHWRVLERFQHLSLIECQLETGRTHQIRVHLSSIGHALLGDSVYGRFRNFSKNYPAPLKAKLKAYAGQALHAKSLGFFHLGTDKYQEFDSSLPENMQSVLQELRSGMSKSAER